MTEQELENLKEEIKNDHIEFESEFYREHEES
jgi:hypothetical protein